MSDAELLRLVAGGSRLRSSRCGQERRCGLLGLPEDPRRPNSAEDAAQEAFVRIWRNARQFDPRRGSATAWMYTIARNTALNLGTIRHPVPQEKLPETYQDADPADRFWLEISLARLSGRERTALELAYFECGPHSNSRTSRISPIATWLKRLDLPLGTVKTRIRRALGRLADFAEEGE